MIESITIATPEAAVAAAIATPETVEELLDFTAEAAAPQAHRRTRGKPADIDARRLREKRRQKAKQAARRLKAIRS